MSLLKYNYRNSEVGWRYVKIGEDGIFWGRETDKCPLKCMLVASQVNGKRLKYSRMGKSAKT